MIFEPSCGRGALVRLIAMEAGAQKKDVTQGLNANGEKSQADRR